MAKINKELYNSTHDVNYVYPSVSLAELGQKVLELRKKYPNNAEFGNAVESFLLKNKTCSIFPGIQKL
tara:strand:- start:2876 stop:3079 length:204 start_codon:yes stop_codon:yes gene_type:complete